MSKPFCTKFKLNSKLLAVIYICYQYKFPLCFMLSFYEMYGDNSLFALKALSCSKKISLNDVTFAKIIEESRALYKQILTGESALIEIEKSQKLNRNNDEVDIDSLPVLPVIDTSGFSEDYRNFVNSYLLKNINNIYSPEVELMMSTEDLYQELRP